MFAFQSGDMELICASCGAVCRQTGLRQKLCPKCAKDIRAANSKINSKEWRAANIESARARDRARVDPQKNRKRVREWAEANPEKAKALSAKWYAANKEKAIKRAALWNVTNQDRRCEIGRDSAKRRRKIDPIKFGAAKKERRKDPGVRLHDSCSAAIRTSLHGNKGGASWERLVGYTVAQLKAHLEPQFMLGMNWENYGEWHVDHKRPVSSFSFSSALDKEFLDCWALSNLQPLWAADNISKGNKWDKERSFGPDLQPIFRN